MFNDIFSPRRTARATVPNIGSEEFARVRDEQPDAVLLDVRTAGEFHMGHIANSINIDMMDPRFADKVAELDKATTVLIYCRSGNRSYHAGNMMKQMGFEHVYNLASGIIGWREELVR
ncbi:MAG: rhodanese-like domain-containing protein [Ignavibacteria bacterium]|nr:MAG: rhodanese-like domain-containing protein [Ignavibacteria bacterium]